MKSGEKEPERPPRFEYTQSRHPRIWHACSGHSDADLLVADEVAHGAEDVGSGSQESDTDRPRPVLCGVFIVHLRAHGYTFGPAVVFLLLAVASLVLGLHAGRPMSLVRLTE
jgi:hypothetical protein